mmetsp:Transcript_38681/g.62891  ORF Transcript_38681/g.62891 Transcript_38681/m.62891 type:complete len:694 (+) Transcript_38681:143-2224(+)
MSEAEKKETKSGEGDNHPNPKVISAIKKIAAGVVAECESQGEHPSEVICSFLVRAHILSQGDNVDLTNIEAMKEKELSMLTHEIAEKVLSTGVPEIETMKLQVRFETQYALSMEDIRKRAHATRLKKNDLLDRVVEAGTNLKSNSQVESLYRSIFKLLLQSCGIPEAALQRKIERELAGVLETVFPQSQLVSFDKLSSKAKRDHAEQMADVVMGIRLFNRELGEGGLGIEDVPHLALEEAKVLSKRMEESSRDIDRKAEKYDKVLNFEHMIPGSIASSVDMLQNELAHNRQIVLLLNQLLHDSLQGVDSIWKLHQKFRSILQQLRSLVGGKSAVPKETVYPHFIQLSNIWMAMEKEREYTELRRKVYAELCPFMDCFKSSILPTDLAKAGAHEAKLYNDHKNTRGEVKEDKKSHDDADDENEDGEEASLSKIVKTVKKDKDESMEKILSQSNTTPYRIVKESTPEFMTLPLEYQGFCPYTLVMQGGHLVPGEPQAGIITYKGKCFSLAGLDAMKRFCKDPEKILRGVDRLVRKSPHLAHLLCVQDEIANFAIPHFLITDEGALVCGGAGPSSRDVGTQTPTHFLPERNIDPKYSWNEWELRRRALQMASLTDKKTTSAQTNKSHYRRENATQYTLPKPYADGSMPGQGTQTRKSQGTNVPRTKRYFAGLRGKADGKFVEKKIVMDGIEIVEQT